MSKTVKSPDSSLVKMFENKHINEIADRISDKPHEVIPIVGPIINLISNSSVKSEKQKLLEEIADIASESNPEIIDPGVETELVARLFCSDNKNRFNVKSPFNTSITSADIEEYHFESRAKFWEAHRNDIAKNYNLTKDNPFSKVFDNINIGLINTFRGISAFDELATHIPDMIPSVRETKKLNVLYPASGAHIAPVITAMKLIDDGTINTATFTYTEIRKKMFRYLHHIIKESVEYNVFNSLEDEGWEKFENQGAERKIVIQYNGGTINLLFALNRSGKKYYREEYLESADLVIIHDPGDGFFEGSAEIMANIIYEKRKQFPDKDQAIIMEGTSTANHFGPLKNPFPKSINQIEIKKQYGHCSGENGIGEVDKCAYVSARVFLLNDPALNNLADKYKDASSFSNALYSPPMRVRFYKPQ